MGYNKGRIWLSSQRCSISESLSPPIGPMPALAAPRCRLPPACSSSIANLTKHVVLPTSRQFSLLVHLAPNPHSELPFVKGSTSSSPGFHPVKVNFGPGGLK